MNDLITRFAQAIATAEGFYVEDSVPQRANNPGDLTDDGEVGLGTIQTAGPMGAKITIYACATDGWQALERKIGRMLRGGSLVYTLDLTLMEVAIKWAGSAAWAENVASALGVDTRTTLQQLVDADAANNHDAVQAAANGDN